ncbi:MAG TPA: peptidoglycan-binding domain-containing protein [Stellaceae bacterium]|nr:peptidoglycan-binding domain-containing protein [Stellaceae bacterium]
MRVALIGILGLSLLTAGCGTNQEQRAATAGLTGAGVGAVVGGPVGAAVGVVVGAVGGAAMPEGADTIAKQALNMEHRSGETALAQAGLTPAATSGSSQPPPQQKVSADTAKQAQRDLKQKGLYHARVDGIVGPKTKQALTAFQKREGLPQTAMLDQPTLDRLNATRTGSAQGNQGSNTAANGTSTGAQQAMLSPSQLRGHLSQEGYSNISDLRRESGDTWSAQAQRGGQTLALQVDGRTGRVTNEQQVAATSQQPSAGSTNPPPQPSPSGANAPNANPPNNGGTASQPGAPEGNQGTNH